MLILDPTTLSAVVDQAMQDAADHPRWLNAINRAVRELIENPYITRQDGHLLIASSSSDKIYSANGSCQCVAFEYGEACWHRAAARLVRRHDEWRAEAAAYQRGAEETARAIVADAEAAQRRAQREIDECFGIGAD